MIDRRKFLQGTAALFCAPAIVTEVMKLYVPPQAVWTINSTHFVPIQGVSWYHVSVSVEGSPSPIASGWDDNPDGRNLIATLQPEFVKPLSAEWTRFSLKGR